MPRGDQATPLGDNATKTSWSYPERSLDGAIHRWRARPSSEGCQSGVELHAGGQGHGQPTNGLHVHGRPTNVAGGQVHGEPANVSTFCSYVYSLLRVDYSKSPLPRTYPDSQFRKSLPCVTSPRVAPPVSQRVISPESPRVTPPESPKVTPPLSPSVTPPGSPTTVTSLTVTSKSPRGTNTTMFPRCGSPRLLRWMMVSLVLVLNCATITADNKPDQGQCLGGRNIKEYEHT